jgi:hypothetical protein
VAFPKLHDYQLKMLEGFKKGEMTIISTGRQTGKSYLNQYAQQWTDIMSGKPAVKIIDRAIVDGEQWYTVSCSKAASMWFRETHTDVEDKLWYEHIDKGMYIHANAFDIHEKLYTLLAMKFAK